MRKHFLIAIFAVAMVLSLMVAPASAAEEIASGTCGDNLTWVLNEDGTLTISGTGAMTAWNSSSHAPWYSYCSSVDSVIIEDGVTSVGNYAFYKCTSMTSIDLPDSLVSIGWYAFSDCTGLTSVTIGSEVTYIADGVFYECSSLTEIQVSEDNTVYSSADGVLFNKGMTKLICYPAGKTTADYTIPSSVTNINYRAFYHCTSLTSVVIPDSVTRIDTYAFYKCTGLVSVTIGSGVTNIDTDVFAYCSGLTSITIPDSVTSIGNQAFYYCTGLTSVTIPDSVTSISSQAFYHCTSLTSVTIGSGVTSIGEGVFHDCISLTEIQVSEDNAAYCSVDGVLFSGEMTSLICCPAGKTKASYTIPDSVTSIENSAFANCISLTSIAIPDSVTNIGSGAFYYCINLIDITIPDSVTSVGSYAFSYCASLLTITIPDKVESIGSYTFYQCTNLTSVTIGSSVTSIDSYAFQYCTDLTSLTISDSVISIGDYAFSHCTSLTTVTIPDSVTDIGSSVFYRCTGLVSVTIGSSVASISSYMFNYCTGLVNITIPDGVESIEVSAFASCTALTAIVIPDSVTTIGNSAFNGCSALTDVYYGGTEAAWNSITIDSSGNSALDSAEIHYNSVSSLPGHVNLSKLAVTVSGVTLSWNSAAYAEGYYIYRSTNGEETYQLIATVSDASTLSYTDTEVGNETTYSYYVQAYAGDEVGTYSAQSVTYLYTIADDYRIVSLAGDALDYTNSSIITKQILYTQRNGIYFLNDKHLYFYAMDTGECTLVYTFAGCVSAYESDGLLYVLVSDSRCLVYDLEEQTVVNTLEMGGTWSATAVGVDGQGRIYIAGQTTSDGETVYGIRLYSTDGTLLSQMYTDALIYAFDAFDSTNGNFYIESYYSLHSNGVNYSTRALTMGTVTNDVLEPVIASSSTLIGGLLTYSLDCIECLCRSSYYLHQDGAALLNGQYLVTASTVYDRVMIMDSNSEDLELCLSFSREGVEYESDSNHYDTGSIGVRTVYDEENNSIIIYENDHTLTEYSLETGKKISSYETRYSVFNLMMVGNTLYIIEKEDDAYYLEVLTWRNPESISPCAVSTTLEVGELEALTVSTDTLLTYVCTWQSSDSSVISVSSSGRIAAWSEGTAQITVTAPNGLSNSITITVTASDTSGQVSAIQEISDSQITDNASDNNYSVVGSTMNSALYESGSGTLVRVEYADSSVLVEEWSVDGTLLSSRTLTCELPLYGGFYSGSEYNFLVFGQSNSEEDDSCEVLRVVKYSKDWERLDACSVYGSNTYFPFNSGSLRMTEAADSLYLHTCHVMYAASDGRNHQANMTLVINQGNMSVQQSFYNILNIAQAGYVSHSFNQFIQTDGTCVYRVDHGDAAPRAVSITKCSVNGSITDVSYTYALTIQNGDYYGDNNTGVSVGGFELSTDNCLIVGNSVDQSDADTYSAYGQRNIFLTVTDKDLENTTTVWLTDYTDSDNITPRTPQLVKLNDEQFLIIWEEYNETTREISTRLVTVSGDGEIIAQTETSLRLSDCQPIFTSDGLVCWYVTDGESVRLYAINPYQLENIPALDDDTPSEDDPTDPTDPDPTEPTDPDPTEPTDPDPTEENPFTDVNTGHYFYNAVLWAIENGITSGTSDTTFSPYQEAERCQVVTFLWRAAGCPEVAEGTENPFTDVSESDYFYTAVLWAVEKGITSGTTATTFSPFAKCERCQVVTFLYRYFDEPEVTTSENLFTDVDTDDYFYSAVLWAVQNGVTSGTAETTFGPFVTCERCMVVTFLYRALVG